MAKSIPDRFRGFIAIADNGAEFHDIFRIESHFEAGDTSWTPNSGRDWPSPYQSFQRLDTIVPSVDNFMDRSRSHRGLVLKLQGNRYNDLAVLFEDSDIDQVGRRVVNDFSGFELKIMHTVRTISTIGDN